jgi:hypothetical protein
MSNDSVTYDAGVIQEFAERLYKQAASIIFSYTFMGILGGGITCLATAAAMQAQQSYSTAAIIGAIFGGVVGFSRGRERAFKLKLEAQVALCQVQIEKNTNASREEHKCKAELTSTSCEHA